MRRNGIHLFFFFPFTTASLFHVAGRKGLVSCKTADARKRSATTLCQMHTQRSIAMHYTDEFFFFGVGFPPLVFPLV